MEEYRVDFKVRNNVILKKIEDAGYKTVGEFCRLNNIVNYTSHLGNVISMKESPLNKKGEFRAYIVRVAELLGCSPLDLFTDTQLHTILKTNKRSIEVNEAEAKFMIENHLHNQKLLENNILLEQRDDEIENQLHTLTKREEKVINMRFGLGEYTREYHLDEIGLELGLSRERVRQIEARALRKLRHPSRADLLREFINES